MDPAVPYRLAQIVTKCARRIRWKSIKVNPKNYGVLRFAVGQNTEFLRDLTNGQPRVSKEIEMAE